MATVTGLTADRMLAIEAASVVDGDVVGDNLILTKHDGTQINAGSVRGPEGPQGPVGTDLGILLAKAVLDVGLVGQIRAGRQLSAADFTDMGLNAPLGLWNLSNLNDSSGNGRNLLNKNGVGFGTGINGDANTAAVLGTAANQALYIADSGAADPFRIKVGTYGCWMRTAKKGTTQRLLSKITAASPNTSFVFDLYIDGSGFGGTQIYNGAGLMLYATGISDCADDRWHFIVGSQDGTLLRLYVDGILEATTPVSTPNNASTFGPVNIGSFGGDSSNNPAAAFNGRIDEAFITADVLSDEQIRNLYCAKIPHTLGVIPSRGSLSVTRRRKGGALAVGDFPVQPVRLHNFSAGSFGDAGSNNVPLANAGTNPIPVQGPDGVGQNALHFGFNSGSHLAATDAGMPAALTPRSYGCWMKSSNSAFSGLLGWGTVSSACAQLVIQASGALAMYTGSTGLTQNGIVTDNQWHFVVGVEDNAAADGLKRKLYVDGRVVASDTTLGPVTLAGANRFRVGANIDGTVPFLGQIDGVFVCAQALTGEQIQSIYTKGVWPLAPSPKNIGDHVEAFRTNDVLATFDWLEATSLIDLKVAA